MLTSRSVAGSSRDVLVADQDAAGARVLEAGDQAQRRGLAAAARAEQGDQRPRLDRERDVTHRDDRTEGLGHPLEHHRSRLAAQARHAAGTPTGWAAATCISRRRPSRTLPIASCTSVIASSITRMSTDE